jgi:aldose 1-epimerase
MSDVKVSHPIYSLRRDHQCLDLVPSFGGGVAAWRLLHVPGAATARAQPFDLWRPWSGAPDPFTLAAIPLVPWSNRISGGGFDCRGVFFPVQANRDGQRYPIHGDGWLQAWEVSRHTPDQFEMVLESDHYQGGPYAYRALQRFALTEFGIKHTLEVVHTGASPLPYGLGLHPWLERTPGTTISAPAQGMWLRTDESLPDGHVSPIPAPWDPSAHWPAVGSLVDNVYSSWSGQARIDWPESGVALQLSATSTAPASEDSGYLVIFRPESGPTFCVEPVTHPIDAFHMPGLPGLKILARGESLALVSRWTFGPN